MKTEQFKLTEQEFDQIVKLNLSIEHQSVRYTRAQLQIREMESGINGLYQARQQFMGRFASDHGLNPLHIHGFHVDDSGHVTIQHDPPQVQNGISDVGTSASIEDGPRGAEQMDLPIGNNGPTGP